MTNQQEFATWKPKLTNGKENHKRRSTAMNGSSSQSELFKLQDRDLTGSRYMNSKKEGFRLPTIHTKSKGDPDRSTLHFGPESKSRNKRGFDRKSSSQTPQVRQIMPGGFVQFWMQYKPSLAIQSSTICQDIDALSIEVIRQHNEPCVVLPFLQKENKY